jgi:very-short-patch-repair endonuclease
MAGLKFRRQHPIGANIADFACDSAKLVIELDGGQDAEREQYDQKRSDALKRDGWRVLRFWNPDVLRDPESIIETVLAAVAPP